MKHKTTTVGYLEYDCGYCGHFAGRSQTIRCLWPVTDVFQLKTRRPEVQSCRVSAN